jgi:hypothetical protein
MTGISSEIAVMNLDRLPAPGGLKIEHLEAEPDKLLIITRPTAKTAACPTCGATSGHVHRGVSPAMLGFYTVAYCAPCRSRPSGSVRSRHRFRPNTAMGVLHAILTPRIETQFMACNVAPRSESWRAFDIARHDNTP